MDPVQRVVSLQGEQLDWNAKMLQHMSKEQASVVQHVDKIKDMLIFHNPYVTLIPPPPISLTTALSAHFLLHSC